MLCFIVEIGQTESDMLVWLWCFSGECEEQMKKLACLLLDEEVRGKALPEGNK